MALNNFNIQTWNFFNLPEESIQSGKTTKKILVKLWLLKFATEVKVRTGDCRGVNSLAGGKDSIG